VRLFLSASASKHATTRFTVSRRTEEAVSALSVSAAVSEISGIAHVAWMATTFSTHRGDGTAPARTDAVNKRAARETARPRVFETLCSYVFSSSFVSPVSCSSFVVSFATERRTNTNPRPGIFTGFRRRRGGGDVAF
jgi:hypothetical protein